MLLTVLALRAKCICDSILDKLSCRVEESRQEDEENGLNEVSVELVAPDYVKLRAGKRCCSCCKRSNRQEALFPCGRFGIGALLFQFQFTLNISLLALVALGGHQILDVKNHNEKWQYVLLILAAALYLYVAFYVLLVCIRKYMLITHVSAPSICRVDRTDEGLQAD